MIAQTSEQLFSMLQAARENDDSQEFVRVRNELVELYYPLLQKVSKKIWFKCPSIDQGELISAGFEGLADAITRYDSSLGKFVAYATMRIRGSIIDHQRRQDSNGRVYFARLQEIDKLEQRIGRPPTREDIESHLGFVMRADRRAISLDSPLENSFNKEAFGRDLVPAKRVGPLHDLSTLLIGFTKVERLIVLLYHVEGYSQKQIGNELDLSESRVSQIYTELIPRLRQNAQRQPVFQPARKPVVSTVQAASSNRLPIDSVKVLLDSMGNVELLAIVELEIQRARKQVERLRRLRSLIQGCTR